MKQCPLRQFQLKICVARFLESIFHWTIKLCRILGPHYSILRMLSGNGRRAIKARLCLDVPHHEQLLYIGKSQAQKCQHIAQTLAQAREHRGSMLDLEHQAIHDSAITRQEILNEQNYGHHKRLLKLERKYASPEIAIAPRKLVP